MSVKNRERQIFDPRISRTYIIIYSDVPWVFLDHLENYLHFQYYIFTTAEHSISSKQLLTCGL